MRANARGKVSLGASAPGLAALRSERCSAHQPRQDVLHAHALPKHRLYVGGRTCAQRAGNLDRGYRLASLRERDGEHPALVGAAAARRTLGGVQRCAGGALARLLAKLRMADAGARHQPYQLERELVADELVMGHLLL